MKKSLVMLFAALLISSVCFAEQAPVAAANTQANVAEKKQATDKKVVKPSVKKSGKKVQKPVEPIKK